MHARAVRLPSLLLALAMAPPLVPGPLSGAEPAEQASASILAAAVAVVDPVALPRARREENLTWLSDQLVEVARLLVKAGRGDQALRMLVEFETPDRVKAPGFVPVAAGAIRAGDRARAGEAIERLAALREWTAPIALADVALALDAAGDAAGALKLAARMDDPAARARALLAMGRPKAALRAAKRIPPWPVHAPHGEESVWEDDYGDRQAFLLRLAAAFVERGDVRGAERVVKALDDVADRQVHLSRARAWLAIARARPFPALDTARAEVRAAPEERLGDTLAKAEILALCGERLAAAGRQEEALAALAESVAVAERVEGLRLCEEKGVSPAVGPFARTARGYLAAGARREALDLLERAARLLTEEAERPVVQKDEVEGLARLAAAFELAGEAARAEALLGGALARAAAIADDEWRPYAWRSIAAAYLEIGRPDRAIAILGPAPSPRPDDKMLAVIELEPAATGTGQLLALLPLASESLWRIELVARVAGRLDAEGRGPEAEELLSSALASIAARPLDWHLWLIRLANEYPASGRPLGPEDRRVLRGILAGLSG